MDINYNELDKSVYENNKFLIECLIKRKNDLGLTLEDLTKKTGLSARTLSNILSPQQINSSKTIYLSTVFRLLIAMNMVFIIDTKEHMESKETESGEQEYL